VVVQNLQGDVQQIRRASDGIIVAVYDYNAWGEVLFSSGWMAQHNPLRYRGKYFDNSTGLYYLQSRFYDPMIGRFINADGYVSTGQGILGFNMFTYCLNNPANMVDHDGYRGTNLHSSRTNAMATLMSRAAAASRARARRGTNLHSAATNRNIAARAPAAASVSATGMARPEHMPVRPHDPAEAHRQAANDALLFLGAAVTIAAVAVGGAPLAAVGIGIAIVSLIIRVSDPPNRPPPRPQEFIQCPRQ